MALIEKLRKSHLNNMIILVLIFFVSLHPYSSFLGGMIYLLIGWAIPTIINIYLSWYIVFKLLNMRHVVLKVTSFFFISLLLGVHINIFYMFDMELKVKDIVVYKPLHHPPKWSESIDYTITPKSDYMLKTSVFDHYHIGGNEACGCLYFKAPPDKLQQSIYLHKTQKGGSLSIAKYATYLIHHDIRPTQKWVHIRTTIRDKEGGFVKFSTFYPRYLLIKNAKHRVKLNSEYFWQYAMSHFLNSNIWQWYFSDDVRLPSPQEYVKRNKHIFFGYHDYR